MLTATVTSSTDSLRQRIFVNDRHWLETDEPEDLGGGDTAPTPLELLPAALASCVVTTIRMFARRKGWELDEIGADVVLDREVRPAQCTIVVRLPENVSEERRRRLEQVAKACAVHRTLERGIAFDHAIRVSARARAA
jgi:putative redox protein